MSKIIIESIVEGISTLKDGSLKLVLTTQEVDNTVASALFGFRNKFVKCLLSDSNVTTLEAELIDKTKIVGAAKQKSESQRLRAVLFRIHEQSQPPEEFEVWYKNEMNKIIDHYKLKLD